MARSRLIEQLIMHEGKRSKPYQCTARKTTIGVGRNLDEVGLSDEEIAMLLINDIDRCTEELKVAFKWFEQLDEIRQRVLIDMCFNLGISRLRLFKKTLTYIRKGEYGKASAEMLDSLWAKQVGQRAERLSKMMATGEDY